MNIDRDEAQRRLSSGRNLLSILQEKSSVQPVSIQPTNGSSTVEHRQPNRAHRGPALSVTARDKIAEIALTSGRTHGQIAEEFEISPQSVADSVNGHRSGRPATLEHKAKMAERTERLRDTALDKLMQTLGLIKTEDLELLKPKELSRIGVDMARIHNSLAQEQAGHGNNVHLVIMAPPTRQEKDFKVIEV